AADREVIEAAIKPEHRGPSAELKRALEGWPGTYYWSASDGPGRLVLILPVRRAQRERWWLHGVLFCVTFISVAAGGAFLTGSGIRAPSPSFVLSWDSIAGILVAWVSALRPGINFALALMAILLAHECGHYFLAQRYIINASPPYFLPAPYQINFIGTFGAFIRLRSPIADRRQLMDVGSAGPWAGFFVAIIFLVAGLLRSHPVGPSTELSFLAPVLGVQGHGFGDSPLTWWLRQRLFEG